MEGFEAEQYNKILGLEEKGLTASTIAAVGYRSADDRTQFDQKVRKPIGELFEVVSWEKNLIQFSQEPGCIRQGLFASVQPRGFYSDRDSIVRPNKGRKFNW